MTWLSPADWTVVPLRSPPDDHRTSAHAELSVLKLQCAEGCQRQFKVHPSSTGGASLAFVCRMAFHEVPALAERCPSPPLGWQTLHASSVNEVDQRCGRHGCPPHPVLISRLIRP